MMPFAGHAASERLSSIRYKNGFLGTTLLRNLIYQDLSESV